MQEELVVSRIRQAEEKELRLAEQAKQERDQFLRIIEKQNQEREKERLKEEERKTNYNKYSKDLR